MSILHSHQTEALINRLVSDDSSVLRISDSQFSDFIRSYYYGVAYEELDQRDVFDLRGAALAHFELCKTRKLDETKIRLYFPDVERDGWRSKFAVLEIVTLDRPFLVDSVSMVLNQVGCKVHHVVHPVFAVKRNASGRLQRIAAPLNADFLDGVFESFLHFEFDRPADESDFVEIEKRLRKVLTTIKVAVEDWRPMRVKMKDASKSLENEKKRSNNAELEDYAEFCSWLAAGNFSLFGYCEINWRKNGRMTLNEKSLLGIFRDYDDLGTVLPIDALVAKAKDQSIIITKANTHSPIHRASYLDVIVIPKFSAAGNFTGIRVVAGLFSSTAYNGSASLIPLLRTKSNLYFSAVAFRKQLTVFVF